MRILMSVVLMGAVFLPISIESRQTWVQHQIAPGSVRAEILTIGDMNLDGWDDVVYTSWDNCQVRRALNNKNGTLSDGLLFNSNNATCDANHPLSQARNVVLAHALPGRATPQVFVSAFLGGTKCTS